MTEYMGKNDYDTFITLSEAFRRYLVTCAQEISWISHDRRLIGEFNGDTDIYEDDDYYLVQFETWSCGETDTDSVRVPIKYIYDGEYRERYRKILLDERDRKEQMATAMKEWRENEIIQIEITDRAEYVRLKAKYDES